jgi:regulatory protein
MSDNLSAPRFGSLDEQAADTGAGAAALEETEAAYRAALDSAVRSLSQREHGRRELERKLAGKGHDPVLVERVMAYLLEHDLQSDARFAEGFIRSRVQRGYGPMKIRQELSARGIGERDLEDQLTEPSEYWAAIAETGLSKKFGRVPADRDDWAAQARFLARRGFPSDLIYRVLGPQND